MVNQFNRKRDAAIAVLLLALSFTLGCNPKAPATPERANTKAQLPDAYFQTPFQNEAQFIVQEIITDITRQLYFARNQKLPAEAELLVSATEQSGTPADHPAYDVTVQYAAQKPAVTGTIKITEGIWSATDYQSIADQIAKAMGLSHGFTVPANEVQWLRDLTDAQADSLVSASARISADLEKDFSDAQAHEQAAVLLGIFLLRDHSGEFFEIRTPLCSLTAQLVLAHFMAGDPGNGINARLAEAIQLTLVYASQPALDRLNGLPDKNPALAPWLRMLKMRASGDYRLLNEIPAPTEVEQIEQFRAFGDYASSSMAWTKLSEAQKQNLDYIRVAQNNGFSVEMGHTIRAISLPLEFQELNTVYTRIFSKNLAKNQIAGVLNELPTDCFETHSGKPKVAVLSWGQWALFLQRHLAKSLKANYDTLFYKFGLPDDAKNFSVQYQNEFRELRYYPFILRFFAADEPTYHQSVEEGFKVTVASPQLVPAECWNFLCYKPYFAPAYQPNPNPHVNEWHSHNPLPGTIYDLYPRLRHPSFTERSDYAATLLRLHQLNPYDCRIVRLQLAEDEKKGGPGFTTSRVKALLSEVLPYSLYAQRELAATLTNQPAEYTKICLQMAALDPAVYYTLTDFALVNNQTNLAESYMDKAAELDPDAVRASNYSLWRVKQALKRGDTTKARQIAEWGAAVYSANGLEAKAYFLEQTGDVDGALVWYQKLAERYNEQSPLFGFCLRYQNRTGDQRFAKIIEQASQSVFPQGRESVSLKSFSGLPQDGVYIGSETDSLLAAGMHQGDVIVALNQVRTHNFNQYMAVRGGLTNHDMHFIVWQKDGYHEITAAPAGHLFGANFYDYIPR